MALSYRRRSQGEPESVSPLPLPYSIHVTRRGRSQRVADIHRLDYARIIARRLMPTADSVVVKDRHGALVFDSALFDGGNDVA